MLWFNFGWNNNVAVKIVACWHWNVFTSWLDRQWFCLQLLYMLDVIHLIVTVLSDRPSFEWECNIKDQTIWFRPLKLTFSTCFRVVDAQHGMDAMLSGGKNDGARDGDWRRWLSSLDVTFLRMSQGPWKGIATLCRLCELYYGLTVLKRIW